jgi:hypothetical protein
MIFRKDLVVILVDTVIDSKSSSINMVNESLKKVFNDKNIKSCNKDLLLTQSNTNYFSSEFKGIKPLILDIDKTKNYQFSDKKITKEKTEGVGYITKEIFLKIKEWEKTGFLKKSPKISFIIISDFDTNDLEDDEHYLNWVKQIHNEKNINYTLIGITGGNLETIGKNHDNIETIKINDSSEELKNKILEIFNSHKTTFTTENIKKHALKYISVVIFGITIFGFTFIKCETILYNETVNETIIHEQNNFYEIRDSLKKTEDIHPNTNIEVISPKTKTWKKNKELEFKLIYTDSLENFSLGQYYIKHTDQLFIISNAFQKYINNISKLYPNPEKVEVKIQGETDAHKIGDSLYYLGEFGTIINEKFTNNSLEKDTIPSIYKSTQVSSNEELAFLRAKGFWFLFRGQNDYFSKNKTTYQYLTKENENDYEGKYRKIVFTVRIIN